MCFPLRLGNLVVCINILDEKLVVGTRQGNLLIYEVKSNGIGLEESDSSVQLVKSNKFFSKKPIIQVKVVPEQEILISLSGIYHYAL